MRTLFATILVLTISFSAYGMPEGVPDWVTTPDKLSTWMTAKMEYQAECDDCDKWKKPEETIKDLGGDCEDFAILAKAVLKDLGMESTLIFISGKEEVEGKEKTTGHMILIYTNEDGTISWFDNYWLRHSSFTELSELLDKHYPTWTHAAKSSGRYHHYYGWIERK